MKIACEACDERVYGAEDSGIGSYVRQSRTKMETNSNLEQPALP